MVAVQLDQDREELLDQLARVEGTEPADIVRRVLEDYLDFQSLPRDDEADWAEASAALTPEIMGDENWGDVNDALKFAMGIPWISSCKRHRRPCVGGAMIGSYKRAFQHSLLVSAAAFSPPG